MALRVYTDATCDLPAKYVHERNLMVLPMTVILDGKDYSYSGDPETDKLDVHTFYAMLRAGKSGRTAQVNVQLYTDVFNEVIEAGDDCVYIAFSSGLSGSYEAACLALQQAEQTHPGRIWVVDSLSASLGQGLLVHLALDERDRGATAGQLAAYVEKTRLHVQHWFTVDDLMHLKRGGRVSGATAVVGTMLSIKPVLHVDDEGHLIPVSKVQGRKRALKALVDKMIEIAPDAANNPVFISHGDCEEDAVLVADLVKKRFDIDAQIVDQIGPVVGAHSGPGTVALFFVAQAENRD